MNMPSVGQEVEELELSCTAGEKSKIAKSFWKIVGHFLKMLPYDPAISILGIYPRENKACVHSRIFA